jgi:S-adenosylmethionine:tRNA ribosyltransferase-isomerase
MTKYTLDDFNFELPEELIAVHPGQVRDASRMMVVDRSSGTVSHHNFSSLPDFFEPDDILVMNNTRVIKARLFFKRASGGNVEFVLNSRLDTLKWTAITNRSRVLKPGEILYSQKNSSVIITITGRADDIFEIETSEEFTESLLDEIGDIPLPPYMKRSPVENDSIRYQTIYASIPGAAAAPTAGLHFTDEVMRQLEIKGIKNTYITLHTGWGTFSPVRETDIAKHKMHKETYTIYESAADEINRTRKNGGRVAAVGTTSLRAMESAMHEGIIKCGTSDTDIFIYPPYQFKSVDAMLTNFHTPGSTLLMLVSAFGGYDLIRKAYMEAVDRKYRFFSYGDAMLIL